MQIIHVGITLNKLLYHGLFRTRWEKEERLEDQIQQFKAELNSPETVGLNWETIEKQRKLLVDVQYSTSHQS